MKPQEDQGARIGEHLLGDVADIERDSEFLFNRMDMLNERLSDEQIAKILRGLRLAIAELTCACAIVAAMQTDSDGKHEK